MATEQQTEKLKKVQAKLSFLAEELEADLKLTKDMQYRLFSVYQMVTIAIIKHRYFGEQQKMYRGSTAIVEELAKYFISTINKIETEIEQCKKLQLHYNFAEIDTFDWESDPLLQ